MWAIFSRWRQSTAPYSTKLFLFFSCQSSSIPTLAKDWVTDWLMIHHSESDNLQLPYTSKLDVIWDQTTFNFLVYNLRLPHGRHGHHGRSQSQDIVKIDYNRHNCNRYETAFSSIRDPLAYRYLNLLLWLIVLLLKMLKMSRESLLIRKFQPYTKIWLWKYVALSSVFYPRSYFVNVSLSWSIVDILV